MQVESLRDFTAGWGENSVLTNPFITTRTGADHKVYQLKSEDEKKSRRSQLVNLDNRVRIE